MVKVDDIILNSIMQKFEPIISDYMKKKEVDCHVVGMVILNNVFYTTGNHLGDDKKLLLVMDNILDEIEEKSDKLQTSPKFDVVLLKIIQEKIEEFRVESMVFGFFLGKKFHYLLYGEDLENLSDEVITFIVDDMKGNKKDAMD